MPTRFPTGVTVSEAWWGTLPDSSRKNWRRVFRAYTRYGVKVIADPSHRVNFQGYVYSEGEASLFTDVKGNDPALALHDLAHWRVAPVERRNLPNWGLGDFPNYDDKAPRTVDYEVALEEESLASTLGGFMAGEILGLEYRRYVMRALDGGDTESIHILTQRGLLVKRPRSYRVVW